MQDSYQIRALIMQNAWETAASAGWFGYADTLKRSQINFSSVDNSYLLFVLRRGFGYLVLFLLIPVVLTLRAGKAFGRALLPQQRFPLAVAIAVVLGTMASMYTVWFGFVYAVLWMMTLALANSMMDVLIYGPPRQAQQPQALPRRRGGYVPSRAVPAGQPVAVARGL